MTGDKRRPGGDGGNSRRFATVQQPDGSELKVPAVKDAGTFIYMTTDGQWPKHYTTVLLIDSSLEDEFELEEGRPGHGMGNVVTVRVLERRLRVVNHPGKYGQIKRLVLVTPTVSNDEMAEMASAGLRKLGGGN